MNKKILIVDDALFMRTMLKKILRENGYQDLIEAADGNEACELYQKEKPGLVLLDISMPNKNGIDALREIREWDQEANVIMCSAVGQEAMILEAIQTGAADFIVKPFKPEQIIQAAEKFLGN